MSFSPLYRGNSALGASRQTSSGYLNGTGGTLVKGQPVSLNSSGNIIAVNVSSESSVKSIVGVCAQDIGVSVTDQVVDNGRLENITISYAVNTPVYIDKTGALTSTIPVVGVNSFVSGDFCVFVGIVAKNEFDNTKKDIKLMLTVVGQL